MKRTGRILEVFEDLTGRVAVVTGAAGGVGSAVCSRLLGAGAHILAVDSNESVLSLRSDAIGEVVPYVGDISQGAVCGAVVEAALERWGAIDVLISNAARIVSKPLLETSEDEWDALMDTNAKAFFLLCKHTVPHMVEAGVGSIVATASISGVVGLSGQAAYCASKGALCLLVKALAVEYASTGVRVNAVAPGAIDTPFLTSYLNAQEDPAAAAREVNEAHPLGRPATPDEVAMAILYLASEVSSYVTGHVHMVDGGYTAR